MDKLISFGICEWVLPFRLRGPSAVRTVFDLGFDGIALELGNAAEQFPLADDYIIQLYQEEQACYNVAFPALACNITDFYPMTAPKGTPGRDMVEYALRLSIKAADKLHIPVVQIPNFMASDIRSEEDLKQASECLQYACDLADDAGIIIGTENSLSAEWQIREIEMVGRGNFQVYFDTQNYHLQTGGYVPYVADQLYPYIIQVHLKDGIGQGGSTLMGYGENDTLRTVDKLIEKGYRGWMIFENEYCISPLNDREKNPYELMKEDLNFMEEFAKNCIRRYEHAEETL